MYSSQKPYNIVFSMLFLYVTVSLGSDHQPPEYCSLDSQFFCYESDDCKPAYVKCDGMSDCPKGEDEKNCSPENCSQMKATHFQCGTECISNAWKCDGHVDCTDGTDEQGCGDCDVSQFYCNKTMECIDLAWTCDGQADCSGGEDEHPSICHTPKGCKHDEFLCPASGSTAASCINDLWKCDGGNDCPNGEDEEESMCRQTLSDCGEDRFFCSGEQKCFTNRWKCDGDNDCSSGEDEENCDLAEIATLNYVQCAPGVEFMCQTGKECVLDLWRCDGTDDCFDGSDESDCGKSVVHRCQAGQFKCESDSSCIPNVLRCSGIPECEDGSDELNCEPARNPVNTTCSEFLCDRNNSSSKCIPLSSVCNGRHDCPDNSDEDDTTCRKDGFNPCESHPCAGEHMMCQPIIKPDTRQAVSYSCACKDGYAKDPITKMCKDINECQQNPPVCDQRCHNTNGSYVCHCEEGYQISADKHICKALGSEHPRLLFTNRYDIRALNMHVQNPQYMPLLSSKQAVAMDFDANSSMIFYSDNTDKKIYTFQLPNADQEHDIKQTDLKITVERPEGMAYDWVHGNLYWSDTVKDTINMAAVKDTPSRTTVVFQTTSDCVNDDSKGSICLDEPRSMAVHPRKGWLFWSDWGKNASIVMAGLDGTNAKRIAFNEERNVILSWPNGIALDLSKTTAETMYWIDARLHSVRSCIIESCMSTQSLVLYSKEKIRHPFSITIFEHTMFWSDWRNQTIFSANKYNGSGATKLLRNLAQPMDIKIFHHVVQPASYNHCENNDCEQLCVAKAWVKSQDTYITPPGRKFKCLCQTGFTLDKNGKTCTRVVRTQARTQTNQPTSVAPGTIAAIAGSAVFVIGLVVALIAFMLVRKVRNGKAKSINFDNPVYKRTTASTDDRLELPRNEYQPSRTLPAAMQPLTADENSENIEAYDV